MWRRETCEELRGDVFGVWSVMCDLERRFLATVGDTRGSAERER